VRLYTNSSCSGSPVATDTAANFASPGITVSVADNSTTTFHVTAANAEGNTSACSTGSITYTEDSQAPQTKIPKHPNKETTERKATFKFKSSEPGSSFKCKLDRKPFKPCTSPKTYKRLKSGKHVFKVRATDPAGNADPTPAKWAWTIKK
jgi:hypothetical protein